MPREIPCDGWWQQPGLGRQVMRQLCLRFTDGKISGSGYDIIGLFTLSGALRDQGQVVMVKRYVGRHTVDYVGQYDGEGLLWGKWHIGPLQDRWLIKFASAKSSLTQQAEIEELIAAPGS